jgi:hypothetical protein
MQLSEMSQAMQQQRMNQDAQQFGMEQQRLESQFGQQQGLREQQFEREQALFDFEQQQRDQEQAAQAAMGSIYEGIDLEATSNEFLKSDIARAIIGSNISPDQKSRLLDEAFERWASQQRAAGGGGGAVMQQAQAIRAAAAARGELMSEEQAIYNTQTGYRTGTEMLPDGSIVPIRGAIEAAGEREEEVAAAGVRGETSELASKEDAKYQADIKAEFPKVKVAREIAEVEKDSLLEALDRAIAATNNTSAGAAALSAKIPGTPAYNLAADLSTIGANSAFNKLADIKAASKTGGGLGQVSERELDLLRDSKNSLKQGQSPVKLIQQLEALKQSVIDVWAIHDQSYNDVYGQFMDEAGGADIAPVPSSQVAPGQIRDGQIIKNPTTGKKMILRNGAWEAF